MYETRAEPGLSKEQRAAQLVQEQRQQRRKVLRDVIFDLNKLCYQAKRTKSSSQEKVKDFSEYLKRFRNYVDFKEANPYCEKNLEFEVSPTP